MTDEHRVPKHAPRKQRVYLKEKVTVSIDRDILEAADKRAEWLGLSRSAYVSWLMAKDVGRDKPP